MFDLPYLAQLNNKDEIVRRLQNGADINKQNSVGNTALWWACWYNRTEIAEILLQNKKINVNLQDKYRNSPFWIACSDNCYAIVLMMLQDARVDINMAENRGWSSLVYACYKGNTQIVQLLLSSGRYIDIHKKTTKENGDIKSGSTALDVAKQTNKTHIVQLLEQYQKNTKETQKTLRNQLNLKGEYNI